MSMMYDFNKDKLIDTDYEELEEDEWEERNVIRIFEETKNRAIKIDSFEKS